MRNCDFKQIVTALQALLVIFSSTPAWAETYCDSYKEVLKSSVYCEENTNFVIAAKDCLSDYKFLVAESKKNLEKTLTEIAKLGKSQKSDIDANRDAYKKTIDMLQKLIRSGEQAKRDIQEYTDHFILPFEWEDLGKGKFPGLKNPEVQKAFREEYCFGDPMKEIDGTFLELKKVLIELNDPLKKLVSLQSETNHTGEKLSGTGANGRDSFPKAKGSENVTGKTTSKSDITNSESKK